MLGLEIEDFHHIAIHFPIALLTFSLLFDLFGVLLKKVSLSHAGMWCFIAGVPSLAPGIVTGFWADEITGHMDDPFPIHTTHGSIQILVTILFVGLLIWRAKTKFTLVNKPWRFIYLGMHSLLIAFLTYGAQLGANLE